MSAQITHERRTAERVVAYVDALGYAYCTECYHAGSARPCEAASPDGNCDRCGRDLCESVELFDGVAYIEHMPVRIF